MHCASVGNACGPDVLCVRLLVIRRRWVLSSRLAAESPICEEAKNTAGFSAGVCPAVVGDKPRCLSFCAQQALLHLGWRFGCQVLAVAPAPLIRTPARTLYTSHLPKHVQAALAMRCSVGIVGRCGEGFCDNVSSSGHDAGHLGGRLLLRQLRRPHHRQPRGNFRREEKSPRALPPCPRLKFLTSCGLLRRLQVASEGCASRSSPWQWRRPCCCWWAFTVRAFRVVMMSSTHPGCSLRPDSWL